MFPIIIVDDSKEDLDMAEREFRRANITNPIHRFDSGAACLNHLRAHYNASVEKGPRPQRPLVIVDLAMPIMNGVQTMVAILEAAFAPVPWMVMLSGQGNVKMTREGYQLGAKTFLTKPLSVKDIEQFLHSNEQEINIAMTAGGWELRWW